MSVSNTEFIKSLLKDRTLNDKQREKIYDLIARDFVNFDTELNLIWKEIQTLKEKKSQDNDSGQTGSSSYNYYSHNPKFISDFLKQFGRDTALKYTSHTWDTPTRYPTIKDFFNALEQEKKVFEFHKIFNYNRNLYNLINQYVFKPSTKALNADNQKAYYWPGFKGFSFGWQYPNHSLVDWCNKEYDNKEENFKYPMEFNLGEKKFRYKGKTIDTLAALAQNVFKYEIQFREESLFKEVKRKVDRLLPDYDVDITDLQSQKLYTYTRPVLNAIDIILSSFQNSIHKEINISVSTTNNEFIIELTHENSFPETILNIQKPSTFLGGDTHKIIPHLFSLCDYSFVSKFKMSNNPDEVGELKILYDNIQAEITSGNNINLKQEPQFIGLDRNVTGFTHRLKFYI